MLLGRLVSGGGWRAGGGAVRRAARRPLVRPRAGGARRTLADGPGTWPLVVLSHGTGGSALALGWLARRLAERGYVAIGANHHGNWIGEPYRPEGFLCWWERAGDLSVLLDHLPAEPWLAGRVDATRVCAAGFSLGAHTILTLLGAVTDMARFARWARARRLPTGPPQFPDLAERLPALLRDSAVFRSSWERRTQDRLDPRLCTGLLIAPPPVVPAFHDKRLAGIVKPLRIVAGEADLEAATGDGAGWLQARLPDSTLTVLPAAGHFVFLPEATLAGLRDAGGLCLDPPGVDRRAIHDQVAALACDLFQASGTGPHP